MNFQTITVFNNVHMFTSKIIFKNPPISTFLRRQLSLIGTKLRNSQTFSPSKDSRYMVHMYIVHVRVQITCYCNCFVCVSACTQGPPAVVTLTSSWVIPTTPQSQSLSHPTSRASLVRWREKALSRTLCRPGSLSLW